jgi:hypothetical protein
MVLESYNAARTDWHETGETRSAQPLDSRELYTRGS